MNYSLLALALAPAVAVALYIYWKDSHEREPVFLLVKCFIGGAFSIIPAMMLEMLGGKLGFGISDNPLGTMFYAFGVVGLSEEISKYFIVRRLAYRHHAFNEPFDGIVYCVMVSMGFAALENVLYVFEGGVQTAIARMFTAVPAHATFACIMGFYMGKAKFAGGKAFTFNTLGLLGAIAFHGAYDYFLFENDIPGIYAGAFVSLIVALALSRSAIRIHRENSPFRIS